MYLNKAFIIGNLTRDPEIRALPSGTKVCSFSIAVNRTYKDKDGVRQESTDYQNIVAFGKLGELSGQYLKKGQQVLVEGRIQTRSWDSNGEKKYRTEIVADNVQFGTKPTGNYKSGQSKATDVTATPDQATGEADKDGNKIDYPSEEINPDDIPF